MSLTNDYNQKLKICVIFNTQRYVMRVPTKLCLSNAFLSHLLSFPLLLLKELSKLHYPALDVRVINEKIVSIGNSDRLQTLTLGF